MSLILAVSIAIRVFAAAWSVLLFRRVRDWRMIFLTAMITLMATRQVLTLASTLRSTEDWTLQIGSQWTELPGLAVSVLAALACYFLDQMLVERKRHTEALLERERQLRQAQKMEVFGQLAGGIAHDFNNLLTAILGNAQLATLKLHGNDEALRHLRAAEDAALRASELTSQILTFARRGAPHREVVDPNAMLTETVPMIRQLLDGRDPAIELVVLLDEDVGKVRVDSMQMTRVILNLASNARDAMAMGGKLTLRLQQAAIADGAEAVRISVTDTGTGIREEDTGQVFEPFFTTKPSGSGTGLGLSICERIVTEHGGTLDVKSTEGTGSTFSVTLPTTGEPLRNEHAREADAVIGGRETVLVVEDEPQVLNLTTRALTSLGYRVLTAVNGVDALHSLEEHTGEVDLVLSDVMMPQMGGNELAARIAQEEPGLPVVLMSGFAVSASTPVHGFLEKPFRVSGLAHAIREALNSARGSSAARGEAARGPRGG